MKITKGEREMNQFNDEERIVLNGIVSESADATKESVLDSLNFSKEIQTDEEMQKMLLVLFEKINKLDEKEWRAIKESMPFPLNYEKSDTIQEPI